MPPGRESNSRKQSRPPQDPSAHSTGDVSCSSLCLSWRFGSAPLSIRESYVVDRVFFEKASVCLANPFPLIVPSLRLSLQGAVRNRPVRLMPQESPSPAPRSLFRIPSEQLNFIVVDSQSSSLRPRLAVGPSARTRARPFLTPDTTRASSLFHPAYFDPRRTALQ